MTNQQIVQIVIVKWGAFIALILCILASLYYGNKVAFPSEGTEKAQDIAFLAAYLVLTVVNFNSWRRALRLEKDRRQ